MLQCLRPSVFERFRRHLHGMVSPLCDPVANPGRQPGGQSGPVLRSLLRRLRLGWAVVCGRIGSRSGGACAGTRLDTAVGIKVRHAPQLSLPLIPSFQRLLATLPQASILVLPLPLRSVPSTRLVVFRCRCSVVFAPESLHGRRFLGTGSSRRSALR